MPSPPPRRGRRCVDLARGGAGARRSTSARASVPAGNAQLLASPPDPAGAGAGRCRPRARRWCASCGRRFRPGWWIGAADGGRRARDDHRGRQDRCGGDARCAYHADGVQPADGRSRWGAPVETAGVVVNRWNRRAELSLRGVARAVGCEVAAVVKRSPARDGRLHRTPGSISPSGRLAARSAVLRALAAETGVVG